MSIFTCAPCGNQIDSDTNDCIEHPLTQELICSGCAEFLEYEALPKVGLSMAQFKLVGILIRGTVK